MIENIDISGRNYEIDEKVTKYISKKLGKLDKYLPKHAKDSAHLEVILTDDRKTVNHSTCELILNVPKAKLVVKDSTINMFAAIDIVEEKLKTQIRKYKEEHEPAKIAKMRSKIKKD